MIWQIWYKPNIEEEEEKRLSLIVQTEIYSSKLKWLQEKFIWHNIFCVLCVFDKKKYIYKISL